jgi:hypothetical protein
MKKQLSILLAIFTLFLGSVSLAQSVRPTAAKPSSGSTSSTPKSSVRPDAAKPAPTNTSSSSVRPNAAKPTPTNSGTPGASVRPDAARAPPGSSSATPVVKTPTMKFDSGAADDKRRQDSRVAYQKANAPKPNFQTPDGKTYKIDPNDAGTQRIRSMSQSDYDPSTRRQRVA